METRDILNYLGQKIGELSLPENTSEEVWAAKLARYNVAPSVESPMEVLENKTWSKADDGFDFYIKLVSLMDSGGGISDIDQSLQIYSIISNLRCLLKDGFFGMAYRYYVTQIQSLNVMPEEITGYFKQNCSELILKYGGTQEEIQSYEA